MSTRSIINITGDIFSEKQINDIDIIINNYIKNIFLLPFTETIYDNYNIKSKKDDILQYIILPSNADIPNYVKGIYINYQWHPRSNYKIIFYCKTELDFSYEFRQFYHDFNVFDWYVEDLNYLICLIDKDIKFNEHYTIPLLSWLCFINNTYNILNTKIKYVINYNHNQFKINILNNNNKQHIISIYYFDDITKSTYTPRLVIKDGNITNIAMYANININEMLLSNTKTSFINKDIIVKYIIYTELLMNMDCF